MKALYKILFFLIVISNLSNGQTITWQRTYGDENINYGYSIVQTPDEGYIAVARTRVQTANYIFAMRLNKFGDTIWAKTFPGYQANQIERTSDGNYIICGYNLIKININGDTLWTSLQGAGSKLKETPDKGFIICLSAYNGPFLFYPKLKKVDSLGRVQWERIYTDSIYDGRYSDITIDNDGNYVMTGNYSDTAYIWDYLFIMKTDPKGNLIWFKKYKAYQYSISILVTYDNNFIIGGSNNKAFLSKYNSHGDQIWFRYYDNGPPEFGSCTSAIISNDGGLAFTGTYHNGNFDYYVRLTKVDSVGNEQWEKLYGFGNADFGYNLRQTSDSGYIITGVRENYNLGDIYIIKTDKTGFSNPPVSIINNVENSPKDFILYQNFPNPFNPITFISFTIRKGNFVKVGLYDVNGKYIKELVNDFKNIGEYRIEFNGSNFASGTYFYSLIVNNFLIETKKMVLIK